VYVVYNSAENRADQIRECLNTAPI